MRTNTKNKNMFRKNNERNFKKRKKEKKKETRKTFN